VRTRELLRSGFAAAADEQGNADKERNTHAGSSTRDNLREWEQIHDELLEADVYEAFLRLRNRYLRSVERHEVQHRLDYQRGLIPVPEILASRLGVENPLDAPQGTLPARARDELSAYLASAVRAEDSPLLELLLLARYLFDRGALGGPYSYAALAAYEGIARELGIDVEALVGHGTLTRGRFVPLFRAVVERDPTELRRAASRVYAAAYGQDVPATRVALATSNREWRH
jgi:hypothetical protein